MTCARAGPRRLCVLLVGVGGQGVLTAARLLGEALHRTGHRTVVGRLHGMSQRGGSVECSVLVGPGDSSLVPPGGAHVLVGFEPLEALRALARLSPATAGVVSTGVIVPGELTRAGAEYPGVESQLARLRAVAPGLRDLDGPALARRAGEGRTLNMVLLGAVAGLGLIPLGAHELWEALDGLAPAAYREANRGAYELGVEWAQNAQEVRAYD